MTEGPELRRAEQRLGTTLRDKYQLEHVIGVGGMAVVYSATHRNRRRFAVKMLHPDLSEIEDVRVRFQREGYVANTVGHPGTVAVLDDDVAEDGSAFLVMELLEGAGLDAVASQQGGRLPIREALGVTFQLLDVLAAAHEKEIVHRDIKPANLFLERSGQVKVLDFGIARLREATASHLATGTGTTLGTPAFMAPEQALGSTREVDAQTDLWAVGATLFTLVSGVLVHQGETAAQVLVFAATRPARSLVSVVPDAPRELVALVARALSFEKGGRFGSAREMQTEVARVHQALWGEPPGKDGLARLLGSVPPLSHAPTERSGPPLSVTASAGPLRPSSNAPRSAPPFAPVGGTDKPMSLTPAPAATAPRQNGGKAAVVAALAGALGLSAAFWLRGGPPAPVLGAAPPVPSPFSTTTGAAATPGRGTPTTDTPRAATSSTPGTTASETPKRDEPTVEPAPSVVHAGGQVIPPVLHGRREHGSQLSPSDGKEPATTPAAPSAEHNPLEMHIQ